MIEFAVKRSLAPAPRKRWIVANPIVPLKRD
jgi:hypothetical protein